MKRFSLKVLTPVLATALVAGCATEHGQREVLSTGTQRGVVTHPESIGEPGIVPQAVPVPQSMPTSLERPPMQFNAPKSIEDSGASAAVLSLCRQAQIARQAGKLDQAEGALSRALRIEPRNPFIWQALASVHLAERQFDFAENEAQKSTSLGRGNPYIEATNLRIVANVRDAHGDAAGALQARAQADDLLNGVSASQ
jgi:hypothetical protein